jgi:hypothetical protein
MQRFRVQLAFDVVVTDDVAVRDAGFHALHRKLDAIPDSPGLDRGALLEQSAASPAGPIAVLIADWMQAQQLGIDGLASQVVNLMCQADPVE